MPSLIEQLIRDSAECILSALGDSDSLCFISEGNVDGIKIPAIDGKTEIALSTDMGSGGIERFERKRLKVLRSDWDKVSPSLRMQIKHGDELWNWDQDTTSIGNVWVTVGLIRVPLVRKQEPHRAYI